MNYIYLFLIFAIFLSFIYCLFKQKNKTDYRIKSHSKKSQIINILKTLSSLYLECNATQISKDERQRLQRNEDAFIYGEVDLIAILLIIERIQPKPEEIFYDLGSGAGKAVIAVALYFDFSKIVGIEIFPGLHKVALMMLKKAQTLTIDASKSLTKVEFVNADFMECDFSDANIIFINATCISYSAWEKLLVKFHQLKKGTRMVVTSKKIPSPEFRVLFQSLEMMSWGICSVYTYIKEI